MVSRGLASVTCAQPGPEEGVGPLSATARMAWASRGCDNDQSPPGASHRQPPRPLSHSSWGGGLRASGTQTQLSSVGFAVEDRGPCPLFSQSKPVEKMQEAWPHPAAWKGGSSSSLLAGTENAVTPVPDG